MKIDIFNVNYVTQFTQKQKRVKRSILTPNLLNIY